jgi:hypothetical protein
MAKTAGRGAMRVIDAQVHIWGTDITRMPRGYRQCVMMFTEELPG